MEELYDKDGIELEDLQPEWENAPTARELHENYKQASSEHSNQLAKVTEWRDAMRMQGTHAHVKKKGKSGVAPKLIRKQAEWRKPSLTEPFMSTPDLFNVRGITHMDVKAAKQNQLLLNYQFNTQVNKRKFIDDLISAVTEDGTAIIRTGWVEESVTETVRLPNYQYQASSDPRLVQAYAQMAQMEQQSPLALDTMDATLVEGYRMSKQIGNPHVAIPSGYREEEQEKFIKNHPTAEVCMIENVIVDPTCNGELDDAMFIIYSYETYKAELEKSGKYFNLDAVDFTGSPGTNDGEHTTHNNSEFSFTDEARNKIVAYEYWGYWDVYGTGELTPIVATYIGDTLIQLEENPFPNGQLPFVSIPYAHVVGSVYGEPDADLLVDNQKVIGAVTRGMIDLMANSANSQQGVRKGFLDAVNKRRFLNGMSYEFNDGNPQEAVYMHKFPEIPVSAYNMLQMQNNDAESMSGIKAFSSGISGQALGDTATGIRNAMDATSKRELAILRRIADGVTKVARRFISMNAEFLSEQEVVRVTDEEFVPIKRDDLAGNFDLELSISTAEADNQKAQELAFMVQTVGNKVDPLITYKLMAEIADLRKMPDTANMLRNYKPQPDPLQQQKVMLELKLLEAQIQQVTGQAQNQATGAQENLAKARNLDADTDNKKLEFLEQESGVNHAREMEQNSAQSRANAQLEVIKHSLSQVNTDQPQEQS